MEDRAEDAGELKPRLQWSGALDQPQLELEVRPEPSAAASGLPDLYGIPRLEFLIVDPDFAFVAWEITGDQLRQAHATLGDEAFSARVLQLRLHDPDNHALAGFNLYGEAGRWFLQPGLPGAVVSAVLGYASGAQFYELLRRGPVAFPRNAPVDAEHFVELHVEYERGPHGQLLLASRNRRRPQPWPTQLSPAALAGWARLDGVDGIARDGSEPGGSWSTGSSRGLSSAGRIPVGPTVPAGDRDD
jgi:hypothetical protein